MPVPPALGRAARIFRRGLRLACPRCGGARLFSGWFTMTPECPLCGLRFDNLPIFELHIREDHRRQERRPAQDDGDSAERYSRWVAASSK